MCDCVDLVQRFDEGDVITVLLEGAVDAFQHHVVEGIAILVDTGDKQDADLAEHFGFRRFQQVRTAVLTLDQTGRCERLKIPPDRGFRHVELLGKFTCRE